MGDNQIYSALSVLAACQRYHKRKHEEHPTKRIVKTDVRGICVTSSELPGGVDAFSIDKVLRSEDPKWTDMVIKCKQKGRKRRCKAECYSATPTKKIKLVKKQGQAESIQTGTDMIEVDMFNLTATDKPERECHKYDKTIQLKSGSTKSKQGFFPLAVDDYFMSVAILAQRLGCKREGACIVSNESLHVISIGYCTAEESSAESHETHAVLNAILNADQVDLKTCSLYTTVQPCLLCTEAIINTGITAVVYGGKLGEKVNDLVYDAKACFKKYTCYIRIANKEKKYLINLIKVDVVSKKLKYKGRRPGREKQRATRTKVPPIPSYHDFFMSMAFLSHTRAKDMKYQVGACLVTPSPHRLVAMGYNGMPDGRGFQDIKMDWGSDQFEYICHAELNAIIAAFRREADLSNCTLYVTHSPCEDCSKLVAQSGIKNLVFAKYYNDGKDMYKTLGRLADMNITRYEYIKDRCETKPIISISLEKPFNVSFNSSSTLPQTDWREKSNTCPLCINKIMKKKQNNNGKCPICKKNVAKVQEKKPKGRRDVNLPKDDYFMALAVLAKCRSKVKEIKVGACIVYHEPRRAISVGYNGNIDGLHNETGECCAELNAIVSAYRYHADLTNATLYTTGYPCARCATTIVQSGIKTIIYGGIAGKKEKKERMKVDEIFYWKKVATLEYRNTTLKTSIEIDLQGLIVHHETPDEKKKRNGDEERWLSRSR